ncbi:MAG: carbamoyltransferase HypF [Candidatus Marinimicrobia bacterium]|nr:carbamoyltransferase HypF [Candidatus Neomarinimicrobiota bacterium]
MELIYKINVKGTVQGVGFRPFVYNLAKKHRISGYVLNNTLGVEIKAQGKASNLDSFKYELKDQAPPQSNISSIESQKLANQRENFSDFRIKFSSRSDNKNTQISPELNVCHDCQQELFDPDDRRYLYPFINCTNCGPRFTITKNIPYDRNFTTMDEFEMCSLCSNEYNDPDDRRFHAQPDSCFECGPQLFLYDCSENILARSKGPASTEQLFIKMSDFLQKGAIISIKSNGGFHLACNALDEEAVLKLRGKKYRYDKALALMFPDLTSIKKHCHINSDEEELLTSYTRPIVLLKKKLDTNIADSVAPENNYLGAMLPYNPIQLLLFKYFPQPLVMTSGNICGEPIIYKNGNAISKLSQIADYHCLHNRKIHVSCDDSVYRVFRGENYPIRRSRGFAPRALSIGKKLERPVLACGAERKNTFAVAKGDQVWLSQHIGDLENLAVLNSFETSIEHFLEVFDVQPEVIAHDLHPDYLSTKYARNYDDEGIPNVAIQHHHAHAVACMVENGLDEPVIAFVMDGTGAGADGTIWGGEILIVEHGSFNRIAHLEHVRMPGGKSSIYNPWEMAVSYLYEVYGSDLKNLELPHLKRDGELELVLKMLENNLNTPITSSCGRLFDAVSALTNIRCEINYEGQAAIELENSISGQSKAAYNMHLADNDEGFVIKWDKLIESIVTDIQQGAASGSIALKFHNSLANVFLKSALRIRSTTKLNKIVLSGGVFMNMYLLDRIERLLRENDFDVYWHTKVPTNDGGIPLGQVMIADSKIRG